MTAHRIAALALLLLAATYALWFRDGSDRIAAWLVFATPPLLLGIATWRGGMRARFWAGVFALGWFSHAVIVLYGRPAERGWAATALLLSLAIIFSANLPGLRARFGKKKASD